MAESAAAWEALDRDIMSMVDLFGTLLKASRLQEDEGDQAAFTKSREARKERAPGDLLEVWAEKLVQAGHNALLHVGDLKAPAAFSDFNVLMNRVRSTRNALTQEEQSVHTTLATIRSEATQLLAQLEDSFYSTPYRGRPVTADVTAELKELAAISLELADKPETLRGTAGQSAGGQKV